MNKEYALSEIMEENFVVVLPEISIGKAMKIMNKNGVRYLTIFKEEIFLGMVSYYDCEYFKSRLIKDGLLGPDEILRLKHHKISEIMHTKLVRLGPNDSTKIAREIMNTIIFQVIPVMEKKKLLGILTPEMILNCRVEEAVGV